MGFLVEVARQRSAPKRKKNDNVRPYGLKVTRPPKGQTATSTKG